MSILQELNKVTLQLRKERSDLAGAFQATLANAKAFAKERVVLSKGDLKNIQVTDEDALRSIQKSIKAVKDTLALRSDHQLSIAELGLLEALLPKMASEEDLKITIGEFVDGLEVKSMKSMGKVMSFLQEKFGTSLDKSLASRLAKEALSG